MEHAKKLILIEPRQLEELQAHMEYKKLLKPADAKRRADLSMELQNVLAESSIADDVKAKQYQQTFRRFQNMDSSIQSQKGHKSVVNPMTSPLTKRQRHQQQQQPQQQQRTTPRTKRTKTVAWEQW
jgi:hypothetical protein